MTNLAEAQKIAELVGYQNRRKNVPYESYYDAPANSNVENLGLVIDQENRIYAIQLTFKNVPLGDIFVLLENPDGVYADGEALDLGIMNHYRGGHLEVFINPRLKSISPYTTIRSGFIANYSVDFPYRWYGFLPLWRYCKLQPDYPYC